MNTWAAWGTVPSFPSSSPRCISKCGAWLCAELYNFSTYCCRSLYCLSEDKMDGGQTASSSATLDVEDMLNKLARLISVTAEIVVWINNLLLRCTKQCTPALSISWSLETQGPQKIRVFMGTRSTVKNICKQHTRLLHLLSMGNVEACSASSKH